MLKKLGILIIAIGVIGVVIGGVFIGESFAKNNQLVTAMRQEKITLGIESDKIAQGELIDTAKEAEVTGDTVRGHRHGIAPTYGDLLGANKFDPTNPAHLTYAQAMNLENYLYLAVLGFGLVQVVQVSGVFMVITGIALAGTGLAIHQISRRVS